MTENVTDFILNIYIYIYITFSFSLLLYKGRMLVLNYCFIKHLNSYYFRFNQDFNTSKIILFILKYNVFI